MNEPRTRISLKSFFWNDYFALLFSVAFLLGIGLIFYTGIYGVLNPPSPENRLIPETDNHILGQIGLGALLTGAQLIGWRYLYIRSFFEKETRVPGKVTDWWTERDRGRIYFQYTHEDTVYENNTAVHLNAKTRSFKKGRTVTVLVDPKNPLKAIIEDLYVPSEKNAPI
ncbi:MAG: hypothetical protein HY917_04845 [Candidatus Diapherotrites archaeon]|nr:hypothetical protein [Candidatus Diapherotrites archaeon]